jgi:hypothetical protein
MTLLSFEKDPHKWPQRYSIWISDASILTPWANSASTTLAVLGVDGTIHNPDSGYLSNEKGTGGFAPADVRCAGIIEATDEEMQILMDAGYRLTDLRGVGIWVPLAALE